MRWTKKVLQRVIRSAEKITWGPLPSLNSIASSRYLSRANKMIKDFSHPGHELFQLLVRCWWTQRHDNH